MPGSYSVSEADPTPGYDLTALSCSDGRSATPSTTSLATRSATIEVDPGETVRCVFTNTRRATIEIEKQTSPADPKDEADQDKFGFAADMPGDDNDAFELDDDDVRTVTNVAPGSYSVSEDDPTPGYDLTGLSCNDGQSATPSTTSVDTRTAVVNLDPGESVRCVFTNTKRGRARGREADVAGGSEGRRPIRTSSAFAAELPGDGDDVFELDDDDVRTVANIVPGSYSVSEDDPTPGYDLTGLTCNDGQSATPSTTSLAARSATIEVDPGETVRCVFTNTKRGVLEVEKQTTPADPKPEADQDKFGFAADLPGDGDDAFELDDDDVKSVANVAPGSYSVSEDDPTPGYDLTGLSCNDGQSATPSTTSLGSRTATIEIDPGESVRCVFTNTKRGQLEVEKQTSPADPKDEADQDKFGFAAELPGDGDDAFELDDDDVRTVSNIVPGSYSVSEDDPTPGYDLTGLSCNDGQSATPSTTSLGSRTATIEVDPGETVRCVFTNTKRGRIEIEKQTDPDEPDASAEAFAFTGSDALAANSNLDPKSFELIDDGIKTIANVKPNDGGAAYDVGEATEIGYRLSGIDCGQDVDSSGSTATRTASIHVSPGETVHCTFTNTKLNASTLVLKEGTLQAHHGDPLTYTFDVTNTGNSPLHDVHVTDDRCSPVSDTPTSKTNDDGDELLEFGEHWVFTCTYNAPADHAADEEDPIHNIATATALDEQDQPVSDTDEHDTDLLHPDIEVDKTLRRGGSGDFVQGPIQVHVGDTIQYRFEVTNEGDTELVVAFSDPRCDAGSLTGPGGDTDADQKLDLAETWVYRCSHVVTTESGDPVHNTVTVTGTDPIGGPRGTDTDTDSAEADVLHPDIEVDKTLRRGGSGDFVQGPIQVHVGDTIQYRFEVTNEGDTPLTVEFSDPRCGAGTLTGPAGDSDSDGKLDLSETWTYRCSHVVTAASGDPVRNTVTVKGTDSLGGPKGTDTDTDSAEADVLHPDIEIDKKLRRAGDGEFVEGPIRVHVGDTIEYRFEVTNEGDTPLTVEFSDPRCGAGTLTGPTGDTDTDGKLDVSETWTYRCSHVVTAASGDPVQNTATVKGTDPLGGTDMDTDSEEADVLHPDIDVDKKVRVLGTGEFVDSGLRAHVGDTLEYRFVVTDGESDTPIADVEFDDPRCDAGTVEGPLKAGGDADELLEPGETWTYMCTHVVTEQDPNPLPNTATVTGHDTLGCPEGDQVALAATVDECGNVEDDDSTSVEILKPGTLVVKEGNQFAYPGDTVTFTFAVTNNGNTPLSDVSVSDDRCAPVTGPTEKLDGDQDDLLEVGEKWMFTCSKQIPADHVIGSENPIRNVAVATGKDPLGRTVQATDDHNVTVLHPAIDIEKTGPATALVGTALAYTLTVTNPGDVPFAAQEVGVTDPRCEQPPAGPDTGSDASPSQLDPGDAWTYTCTAQTTGQPPGTFVNTAHGDGEGLQRSHGDGHGRLPDGAGGPGRAARAGRSGRGTAVRPERVRAQAVQRDGPRFADRPGDVLPGRQADQDDHGEAGSAHLQGQGEALAAPRRPPDHREGGVRDRVGDAGADAASELPALRAPGRPAALHRLIGRIEKTEPAALLTGCRRVSLLESTTWPFESSLSCCWCCSPSRLRPPRRRSRP